MRGRTDSVVLRFPGAGSRDSEGRWTPTFTDVTARAAVGPLSQSETELLLSGGLSGVGAEAVEHARSLSLHYSVEDDAGAAVTRDVKVTFAGSDDQYRVIKVTRLRKHLRLTVAREAAA